jgi:hypothetical protein
MREMILLSPQSLGRRRDVQGLDFLARKCLNALESREKLLSLEEALSYPSEIADIVHQDCAVDPTFQPCLDSVEEHERVGIEQSCGYAITYEGCNVEVSNFYFQMII